MTTYAQVFSLRSNRPGARPGDGTIRWLFAGESFINHFDGVVCFLGQGGALTTLTSSAGLAGIYAALTTLQTAALGYAPIASPGFTGTPTAPTQAAGDSSTRLATTAFVGTAVTGSSPTPTSPAVRSFNTKLWQDLPNLRDWNGYDDSGVNDMASVVTDAFNQSRTAGRHLEIGQGIFLLGSTVTSGGGGAGNRLVVRGKGAQQTYGLGAGGAPGRGTVFHLAHTGVGFNISGYGQPDARNGTAGPTYGNVLEGLATYRDQPAPAANWTPLAADYDFLLHNASFDLSLYIHNATKGVGMFGGCERSRVRFLQGQAFSVMLDMADMYDIVDIDLLDVYPFWSQDTNVQTYQVGNSVALRTKRVDGITIKFLFSIIANKGWSIDNQSPGDVFHPYVSPAYAAGTTFNATCSNAYFDSNSMGVSYEAAASGATVFFGSVVVQPPGQYGVLATNPIALYGSHGDFEFGYLSSNYAGSYHIAAVGTSNRVSVNRAQFGDWSMAQGRGTDAAFASDKGSQINLGDFIFSNNAIVNYTFNNTNYTGGVLAKRPIVGTNNGAGFVRFLDGIKPYQFGGDGSFSALDLAAKACAEQARLLGDHPGLLTTQVGSGNWTFDASKTNPICNVGQVYSYGTETGFVFLAENNKSNMALVCFAQATAAIVYQTGSTFVVSASPGTDQIGVYWSATNGYALKVGARSDRAASTGVTATSFRLF